MYRHITFRIGRGIATCLMLVLVTSYAIARTAPPVQPGPRDMREVVKRYGLPLFATHSVRVEPRRGKTGHETLTRQPVRLVTVDYRVLTCARKAARIRNAVLIACTEPPARKGWADLALWTHMVGLNMARATPLLGSDPGRMRTPFTEPIPITLLFIDQHGRVSGMESHQVMELATSGRCER